MTDRRRFFVALVIEGEVALEIDGIRRALQSRELERLAPHVTIAPPKNVGSDDVAACMEHLRAGAARCGPIALDLGPACSFVPSNGVAFLEVRGDLKDIHGLWSHFHTGPLAPPEGRRERAFVPHVTLASGLDDDTLSTSLSFLAHFRITTVVQKLSLLEQALDDPLHTWKVIADVALGEEHVRGRGGRELHFVVASRPGPEDLAFLGAIGEAHAGGLSFAISVRNVERLVGVATGTLHGTRCVLSRLVVDPSWRREGIGGQLLAEVERYAREKGAVHLHAIVDIESEGFYLKGGFRRQAIASKWCDEGDASLLLRTL